MDNFDDLKTPKVDAYLGRATKWQGEMTKLREIVLSCGLKEDLKWGKPCYSFEGTNVAIIQSFKEFCTVMFFKGVLLKDEKELLVQPGENSQSGRWIPFTSVQQISGLEPTIKDYVKEAINVEKAGLKVEYKKSTDFPLPEELLKKFDEFPELKTAFESLTPGRQRAYNLQFSAPKQSKTRDARIEKWIPQILSGKGMND